MSLPRAIRSLVEQLLARKQANEVIWLNPGDQSRAGTPARRALYFRLGQGGNSPHLYRLPLRRAKRCDGVEYHNFPMAGSGGVQRILLDWTTPANRVPLLVARWAAQDPDQYITSYVIGPPDATFPYAILNPSPDPDRVVLERVTPDPDFTTHNSWYFLVEVDYALADPPRAVVNHNGAETVVDAFRWYSFAEFEATTSNEAPLRWLWYIFDSHREPGEPEPAPGDYQWTAQYLRVYLCRPYLSVAEINYADLVEDGGGIIGE